MEHGPPLHRDQVERVLRRASELAELGELGTSGDLDAAGLADGSSVTVPALLDAAAEVGIPPAAVRRAVAIERLGQPPEDRAGDRLAGPGVVTVDAALAMSVPEAMARLDAWLVEGHHLRRERWSPYEAEWQRRPGVIAAGTRTARKATGEGGLGEVHRLTVVARPDGPTTVVRISVDRTAERAGWLSGGAVVAAAGTTAAVLGALAATPLLLAATPLALGAGAGVARAGRSRSDGVARELHRLVDLVARRVQPTSLRAGLTRWVRGR